MLIHRPPAPIDIPGPLEYGDGYGDFKCTPSLNGTSDQNTSDPRGEQDSTLEGTSVNKKYPSNRSKMSSLKNKGRIKNNRAVSVIGKFSENSGTEPSDKSIVLTNGATTNDIETPKAVYSIDPEFSVRKPISLRENSGYIRFIEKTADELDEVVEYDLDEE
ncbi:unnamed protein product, partial [Trichobilharzia regenti]